MPALLRLLPFAIADGPRNMAADETLLEAATAGTASLRFYGWSNATLSLGYFQPAARRHDDARLAQLPFVRRPSGGEALVHHHELTYCLALPAGAPWQPAGKCGVCMHRVLAAALARLGVTARLADSDRRAPFAGVLCFQHHTPGDLLIGAAKVAGSAQRKQRGALMQHGGLLLAASPHAPELPGVRERTGLDLRPSDVRARVIEELVRETAWSLAISEWTEQEQKRIDELTEVKYRQATWNGKR